MNDDKIIITKQEYENLKYDKEDLRAIEEFIKPMNDFALKIFKGAVIPITHSNYYNDRISIEINNLNDYKIQIDKKYYILTEEIYETIKNMIISELNTLINVAKKADFNYFINNGYEGGSASTIIIKYNSLIIHLNGQVTGEIGDFCNSIIEQIKDIIIKQTETKILEMFKKMPEKPRTPIEEEFDKYAKLYEERFNKRAYIPEPSGTIEFAIECIKKCLDENKDMLDELYYPNFEKDMENGILYSETKRYLNNDKFEAKTTDENIKTIIDKLIKDNTENIDNKDTYLNTMVYDIIKKIIDLPYGKVTTIANLTNYNPREKFIEPLMQGRISFLVDKTCEKLNIELEHNNDKIGGLAYYNEFVKLNNGKF